MFSLHFIFKRFERILRYRLVWYKVPNGINAMIIELNRIENENIDLCNEKIFSKYVYDFSINLLQNDTVSRSIIKYGYWELAETAIFRKIVKKGMIVIDVGANLGYYSLMAGKLVKDGKVYAFEPDENVFSLLTSSINANGLKNIIPIKQCVSNEDGYCNLFINQDGHDSGHNSMVWDKGGEQVSVSSTTLDTFMENEHIQYVNILKIDVEGAEPLILIGARKLLNDSEGLIILMEYNPSSWENFGNLLTFLFQNFDVFEVINSSFLIKKIELVSLRKLNQQTDLFLVKKVSK